MPAALLCCLLASPALEAATPAAETPSYILAPRSTEHDSYILTQLFLAAFDANDLEIIQRLVRQGMLSAPQEFPHFMALVLELVKQPDSRLFMLLSPISEHIAAPSRPVDISALLHLTGLISGRIAPGGKSATPGQQSAEETPLRYRIKFYDDGTTPAAPLAPPAEVDAVSAPEHAESLLFERSPSGSQFTWVRSPYPGTRLTNTAVDSRLENGQVWGGVRILSEDSEFISEKNVFFVLRNGIISFAQPRNVTEADFYANEEARPHEIIDADSDALPGWQAPKPCQMQIQTVQDNNAWPPRLRLYLEQSNAGPAESDFLCRAQCVLTYNWDGEEYVLTRKLCMDENAFGVWPYSPEKFEQHFSPAPLPFQPR